MGFSKLHKIEELQKRNVTPLESFNCLKKVLFSRFSVVEGERESDQGIVTFHVPLILFSALAASSSGMCALLGTFTHYRVL